MNATSDLRSHNPGLSSVIRFLRDLTGRLAVYRRYVRAGQEIEALLSLTDRQLAARHLTREHVGREILAKHGVPFDRST